MKIYLYDRLKPELLINLIRNGKQYHKTADRLVKTLKEKTSYEQLSIKDVELLNTFCNVDMCYVATFSYRFGDHLFIKLNHKK